MKKLLAGLLLFVSALAGVDASERAITSAWTVIPATTTVQGVAGTGSAITYTISGKAIQGTVETPIFAQGTLPTSTGVLYTTPAANEASLSLITLVNTTGSAVSGVKVFLGGSAAGNQVLNAITIPANGQASFASGTWTVIDASGAPPIAGTTYFAGTGLNLSGTTFNITSPIACALQPALTGDTTTSAGSCATSTTKTSGVAFAPSATTDATNANNISSGSLPAARLLAFAGGDVTSSAGSLVLNLGNIPTATPAVGTILHTNIAAPTSPAAGKVSVYSDSTDLRLHDKNAAGTIGTTVVADTGAANNYVSAISSAGVISKSQPGFSNLSGSATCAQLPALTGGVTSSAGSCGTTVITNANLTGGVTSVGNAATVVTNANLTGLITSTGNATAVTNNAITNAMAAQMAAHTFKGNNTGSTANALDLTATQLTAELNPATSSLPGALSVAHFAFLSAYKDATVVLITSNAYANIACDGVTDDAANWNLITANAPARSVLLMPPCTSVIKSAITTAKHFTLHGAGIDKSIIQSNVNAADFLTLGDWYTNIEGISFNGLATTVTGATALSGVGVSLLVGNTAGFPASGSFYVQTNLGWTLAAYTSIVDATHFGTVTAAASTTVAGGPLTVKTGGQAVDANTMNHVFLRDVGFSYVYDGFRSDGTICGILDSNIFGEVNFGIEFNGTNVNSIVHNVTADGIPPAVAHLEVKQAGSLLVSDDDLIRAQSDMRLNPTSPNGVFGVYSVNTYFDTATGVSGTANSGNGVLIQGTGNVQRIKFVNSWLSSATHSGLWANSTAATLPTDIELSGNNIYSNGVDGLQLDTVQDFIVSGNQISGNATAGVALLPGAAAVTNGSINNNQIGPAGGIGANGTGVVVGAGTYGNMSIVNNDISGNTTASQSGLPATVTAPNLAVIGQNLGMFACPPPQAPALALPLTTVTQAGTSCVMRPGARVGSWARITVDVTHTATIATLTPTLKYGTANSNADTSIYAPTVAAGTAVNGSGQFVFDFKVITATTAAVSYKYYNGNGAAAVTGIGGANVLTAPSATVAITNINTLAYLGVYFASSVNAVNTIQSVVYESGQ